MKNNPKPVGLHLMLPDLAEIVAPGADGEFGWWAQLNQYMRLNAEFKQWLAERGEAE